MPAPLPAASRGTDTRLPLFGVGVPADETRGVGLGGLTFGRSGWVDTRRASFGLLTTESQPEAKRGWEGFKLPLSNLRHFYPPLMNAPCQDPLLRGDERDTVPGLAASTYSATPEDPLSAVGCQRPIVG